MIKYFVQHHNKFESKQPNQTIRRSWRNNGKNRCTLLEYIKIVNCKINEFFYVLKNVNTKSLIKFQSTAYLEK